MQELEKYTALIKLLRDGCAETNLCVVYNATRYVAKKAALLERLNSISGINLDELLKLADTSLYLLEELCGKAVAHVATEDDRKKILKAQSLEHGTLFFESLLEESSFGHFLENCDMPQRDAELLYDYMWSTAATKVSASIQE